MGASVSSACLPTSNSSAASGTIPPNVELAALRTRLFNTVAARACLDESRTAFVNDTVNSLLQLVRGQLRGCNRFNRLLLGRKGVGRTHLLDALCSAANEHLRDRRLHCETLKFTDSLLDAKSVVDVLQRRLPLARNLRKRGAGLEHKDPTDAFIDLLEDSNTYLFCVVDEMQSVYTAACRNGATIIRELQAFGDSSRGRILWVLSGSSTDLRKLATSKFDSASSKYSNYQHLDLNGTKFVPASIYPFLSAEDFDSLVKFLRNDSGDGDRLWQLYLQTGGLPGATRACLQNGPASYYSTSAKGLGTLSGDDRDSKALRVVLRVLDATMGILPQPQDETPSTYPQSKELSSVSTDDVALSPHSSPLMNGGMEELDACASWTSWVQLASVLQVGGTAPYFMTRADIEAACYDLADRGILRFDENGRRVSLGSPRVLLDVLEIQHVLDVLDDTG